MIGDQGSGIGDQGSVIRDQLLLTPQSSPYSSILISILNPHSSIFAAVRLALISDIHGNVSAFRAVLECIDQEGVDAILCLGDTVGYGPNPSECIDLMIERGIQSVLGNHDACVIDKLTDSFFSEPNRRLLRWTREHLRPDQMAWLEGLPMTIEHRTLGIVHWASNIGHRTSDIDAPDAPDAVDHPDAQATDPQSPIPDPRFIAAHASPINPDRWQWLDSAITCREVLSQVDYDFVFVGHTHVPALVPDQLGVFGLEKGYKFLINPGSVGQGRDHDRRASFGILDVGNYSYRNIRIHYDTAIHQAELDKLGYTKEEIRRLTNV